MLIVERGRPVARITAIREDDPLAKLNRLAAEGSVRVPPSQAIRAQADEILSRHGLRATDTYHLAAWKLHRSHLQFVCLDQRLRAVAVL